VSGIRVASGHMFFFYAYDAGFEIALEAARALCEASIPRDRGSAPGARPSPVPSEASHCARRGGSGPGFRENVPARRDGQDLRLRALSVTLTLPIEDLSLDEYAEIALSLASESAMEKAARDTAQRLFERIRPAVSRPMFADLVEDYCVWHVGGFSRD